MGLFRNVGTQIHQWVDLPSPRSSAARRVGMAVVSFILLVLAFATALAPEGFDVASGQIAPRDIKAPKETIDRARTEKLREERAAQVRDAYVQDHAILAAVIADIDRAFATSQVFKADPSMKLQIKIDGLMEISDAPERSLTAFLRADDATTASLHKAARDAATKIMNGGVGLDSIEIYRRLVDAEIEETRFARDLRVFAAGVAKKAIRPNLVLSQAETFKRRQEARDSVEPVKVLKGQIIVRTGEIVTEDHMVLLRDLRIIRVGPDMGSLGAAVFFAAAIVLGVLVYLWRFHREFVTIDSRLLLVMMVFFGTLLFAGVLKRVSGLLMPVATGTMLYAVMIDPRFAVLAGVALSTSAAIMTGNDLRFFMVAIAGATAGVFGMSEVGRRSDVMKAGVAVSLTNLVITAALHLAGGRAITDTLAVEDYMWSSLNGVVSAVLTLGLLPFFEGVFGVITPVKLIELSNPTQPLLKRLLVEAPGTYHHSVIVGNLAEAAVEAVGGNSLLARVGAYYHDVGKIRRPYFFIENQMGIENPHDKTSPTLSTLIITSHVRDGIEMARETGLPDRIIDFIREHHGTSLVSYFFMRATESDKSQEYVEADFRYDGPRPSSKETAVVMIADSVEAAVRSIGKPTPARIESIVKKIIKERLNDHQLDKCDLTLKDLDTIADVFTRVLTGLFHPRIEYPENKEEMKNATRSNGTETGRS